MRPSGETLNRVTPGARKLMLVGTLAVAAAAAVVIGGLVIVGAYLSSRPTQFQPIPIDSRVPNDFAYVLFPTSESTLDRAVLAFESELAADEIAVQLPAGKSVLPRKLFTLEPPVSWADPIYEMKSALLSAYGAGRTSYWVEDIQIAPAGLSGNWVTVTVESDSTFMWRYRVVDGMVVERASAFRR